MRQDLPAKSALLLKPATALVEIDNEKAECFKSLLSQATADIAHDHQPLPSAFAQEQRRRANQSLLENLCQTDTQTVSAKFGRAVFHCQPKRLNNDRSDGKTKRSSQLMVFALGFFEPSGVTIVSSPSSRRSAIWRLRISDVTGVSLQLPSNNSSTARPAPLRFAAWIMRGKIGRASCRERV